MNQVKLYVKTHDITGLKYFGRTIKDDAFKYKGSGVHWQRHLKKHGNKVSTLILETFDEDDPKLIEFALDFSIKNNIVESTEWANAIIETGEHTYCGLGKTTVIDKDGNKFFVETDHPKFISGEFISINKNKMNVIDKDGNKFQTDVHDPLFLSGDLVGIATDLAMVKDKNGNISRVSIHDPNYINGSLVGITKGKVIVKDKNGSVFQTEVDNPLYLSGELKHVASGRVPVKDKEGNTSSVSIDDPLFLSGELVHVNTGRKYLKIKCNYCIREIGVNNIERHEKICKLKDKQ